MKKLWMATTVALVAVTIALLTMAYKPGVNEPKQILTVKVIINQTSASGAIITYPNGNTEKIELEFKKNFGSLDKAQEASLTVTGLLNRISSEGYTIKSSSAGYSQFSTFEFYVFEK